MIHQDASSSLPSRIHLDIDRQIYLSVYDG
nr:MAG TPA: hypothetical protein [Caudoviricetes sp.]